MTAGQHAVLYGERGVGKTSLANFIKITFSRNISTIKITCHSSNSLSSLWNKVFKEIEDVINTMRSEANYIAPSFCEDDDEKFNPDDVIEEIEKLATPILIILDEFDNIKSNIVKAKIADTIKILSDNIPFVTLMIVGVAENIEELVQYHPSTSRCLRQIKLKRMEKSELKKILENGLAKLGLTISTSIEDEIISFSQGFPHYIHLLGNNAAKHLIELDEPARSKITKVEFNRAVDEAIESAQEEIRRKYEQATITTRNQERFRNVLWACAMVGEDENGVFRSVDITELVEKFSGKPVSPNAFRYNLGELCSVGKGEALERVPISGDDKQIRYRFKNPMFKVFVRMKVYQSIEIGHE
jgi:Cdc6-like AAA superfamily ATPase